MLSRIHIRSLVRLSSGKLPRTLVNINKIHACHFSNQHIRVAVDESFIRPLNGHTFHDNGSPSSDQGQSHHPISSFEKRDELEETVNVNNNTQSSKEFRLEHEITVKGKCQDGISPYVCPDPWLSFSDDSSFAANFGPRVTKLMQRSFDKPTPIQSQAWPIVNQGRDIISVAKTGSGKTAGFLLPAFNHIREHQKHEVAHQTAADHDSNNYNTQSLQYDGRSQQYHHRSRGIGGRSNKRTPPSCLVLAPTRELAMQIQEEAYRFGKTLGIRAVAIYGGASKRYQVRQLRDQQPQVIVATPGRLVDLHNEGFIKLENIHTVILDEADRMLDMGFEPQLMDILSRMPDQLRESDNGGVFQNQSPLEGMNSLEEDGIHSSAPVEDGNRLPTPHNRQTLFYTATWPESVRSVANRFIHNPVQVHVGDQNELSANEDIEQNIMMIEEREKPMQLQAVIDEILPLSGQNQFSPSSSSDFPPKVLVFCQTKTKCDQLADDFYDQGYNCEALHGDLDQNRRTRIMNGFKRSKLNLLFATDVAARGLDVKDITHVINYDFPMTHGSDGIENYVHRIGRTGRAGRSGISYAFVTEANHKEAHLLVKLLEKAKQKVPEELERLAQRNLARMNRHGRGYRGHGGGYRGSNRGGRYGGRGGRGGNYRGGRGGGRGGGRNNKPRDWWDSGNSGNRPASRRGGRR
eukprot:g2996.t1